MLAGQRTAPTFWPTGGDVLAVGRPLAMGEAQALQAFYALAHEAAVQARDIAAIAYLSDQIAQLTGALHSAARWRQASARIAQDDR